MNQADETIVASCPSCGREGAHRRAYVHKSVQHLRCESCRVVNVYLVASSADAVEPALQPLDFEALTKKLPQSAALDYSTTDPFSEADVIDHPTFGLGYVVTVLTPPKKMEVLFADKRRVLLCDPGSGARPEAPDSGAKSPPSKRRPRGSKTPPKRTRVVPTSTRAKPPSNEPVECPTCGKKVHPYNILHTPGDRPNRCMYCN